MRHLCDCPARSLFSSVPCNCGAGKRALRVSILTTASLLALAACTDPEARCREAVSIYDGLEQRGAADVGLTLVACVR